MLKVDLTVRSYAEPDGSTRYCYLDSSGHESPNLRLDPGDLLILHLKNELTGSAGGAPAMGHEQIHAGKTGHACTSGAMTLASTNLHVHGLTVPPVCHQDDSPQHIDRPGRSPVRVPLQDF